MVYDYQGAQWPGSQESEEAHRVALQTQHLMAQLQVTDAGDTLHKCSMQQLLYGRAIAEIVSTARELM